MKYRLKDQELQRKLDAISGGDFSEKLNTEALKRFSPVLARDVFTVYFGDFDALANRFSVLFELNEVEEVPEYDPRRWNEWPDVEPPRHKLLRTEVLTKRIDWDTPEPRGGQSRFKGSGIFDGNEWYFYDATTRKEGETVRFRPWVDPDEENE